MADAATPVTPAATASHASLLPWIRVPISIEPGIGVPVAAVPGMDARLQRALLEGSGGSSKSYSQLFPVQAVVWEQTGGGHRDVHDLCIAAPTGSGKTLAFTLPILNALAGSAPPHRLRVLVVLPTRELAQQVAAVMQPLASSVGLRVALAAAQASLSAEAAAILGAADARGGAAVRPVSLDLLTARPGAGWGRHDMAGSCAGSGADILVATPGRLMAHLTATPGCSLDALRFLVVDETDRLLRQSYQDWLPHVVGALQGAALQRRALQALPRCVKLIVSATLTHDPAKLLRLALHCPRYVAVATAQPKLRYQLPRSLQEFRVLCSAARKPLTLLALLAAELAAGSRCIVFASSLDTTHKLYLLLKHAMSQQDSQAGSDGDDNHQQDLRVVECSGHRAAAPLRAAALASFRSGQAKVLVASDVVTRGMDLDGAVDTVINYDAPVYAKTYVHRAGRTARAGRAGRVFTLLRDQDVNHFKAMLRKVDNTYVATFRLPPGEADAQQPKVAAALEHVSALLAAEAADDAARQNNLVAQAQAQAQPRPRLNVNDVAAVGA